MSERVKVSGEGPIVIRVESVGSDLRLRGWDQAEVVAKGEPVELRESDDGTIIISAADDLDLRVPYEARVEIRTVGSDAKITDLTGAVSIGTVGASLGIRQVGAVSIGTVGSDLRIKRAEGNVRVSGHVGSDATVREVEGEVALGNIGSDLYVRDVDGPCRATSVGADLVLSTDFVPGGLYSFTVGGDIVCRVPPDADVRFIVSAGGELMVDASQAEIVESEDHDEIAFGEGAATCELTAGGDIRLVGQDEDYIMAINFNLEEDLGQRLSEIELRLSEQLAGLDEMLSKKAVRIRERAEREAERAVERADRALRKADKNLRKRSYELRFETGRRGPRPPRAPEPPTDPVTDDERLLILRMVEERKISVEEAEKLLAALEGRKRE
ncbi:MAG: hypothetical protein JW910_01565 [Anaerolineae bacterium]|nr:hypothetical protein [Anaerolineae bacterium]